MTWQLFSPDLPFLQEMTITQVHHGILEHIIASAPILAVVTSICGAGVALYVAKLARNIASEQKEIAKNKLDFDLFDKRLEIFNTFFEKATILCHKKFKDEEEIITISKDLIRVSSRIPFLFNQEASEVLSKTRENLIKIVNLRKRQTIDTSISIQNEINKITEEFTNINLPDITKVMISYTPIFIYENRLLPTTSPASHPKSQPAAPEQAQ